MVVPVVVVVMVMVWGIVKVVVIVVVAVVDDCGEVVDGCAGWRGRNVGGRYGDSQCYEASLIVPDFTIT